jgi:polysaccharide deacetylase 2 family uncharacterized protein YibQ
MSKKSKEISERNKYLMFLTSRVVAFFALLALAVGIGYYFGYKSNTKQSKEIIKEEPKKESQSHNTTQHKTTIPELTKRLQNVLKQDTKIEDLKPHSELKLPPKVDSKKQDKEILEVLKSEEEYKKKTVHHEYKDAKVPTKPPKRETKLVTGKPKLAIIIDDVSFSRDVKAIKALNLPINMSFLPPTSWHPKSAELAQNEEFYMVHLPLEAQKFNASEPNTLKISDTQQQIDDRIKEIVKMFPKVKFINNHTGSKFTSNEQAINRLILTLNRYDIEFIDSRTTSKTQVQKVLDSFNKRYLARDIFLDHHTSKSYVKKQIKEAIKVAKRHGSAIAIGHPRAETLLAIKESKKLFDEVDLVMVDKLY